MRLFITFEGIEGCGKSTQARALARRLSRRGFSVLTVKEPGSTDVGRVARRLLKQKLEMEIDPVTELLLFEVARARLVTEVIRPALEEGRIVICDRYAESSVAYQGYGRGIQVENVRMMNDFATGGLKADLVILPDLDVEEGLRRKGEGIINDRFEREEAEFHRRVRQGYLEMAANEPERWFVVDASLPSKQVGKLLWEKVCSHLAEAETK
ncbi:MAG: dTMP kinase [Dehalococcoidia bacterium]